MYRFLSALLVILISCTPDESQTSLVLSTDIDTTIATIGDILHYNVILSGSEAELSVFQKIENTETMEVRSSIVSITQTGEIMNNIEIVFWDTGRFSIPSIEVYLLKVDSTVDVTMQTDPQDILIVSSMDPTLSGSMKPVKDPIPVSKPLKLKILGLTALLIISLIFMIWINVRYKKEKLIGSAETIKPLPDAVAIEKLKNLRIASSANLIIKDFYVELSYILREYVENSIFVKTLEMTTEDIRKIKHDLPFSDTELSVCLNLLERSDMIKYAKMIPERQMIDNDIKSAEIFIQSTIPYWKLTESQSALDMPIT